MESYEYTLVQFTGYGIDLRSTHSGVLDWILGELKKLIAFRMSREDQLPSGETFRCYIDRFEGKRVVGEKNMHICWWIVKQLCLQGWEPFAGEDGSVHLRLKVQQRAA